jgi:hypothetical protein
MGGWVPSNRRTPKETAKPDATPPAAPRRRRDPAAARARRAARLPSEHPLNAEVPEDLEDHEPAGRNVPSGGRKTKAEDDRKRAYVKYRPGKRWTQVTQEVAEGQYTWEQFCEGLDPEELARGQLRAEDGTFKGRPPAFVPREFSQYAFKELSRRFNEAMKSKVLTATEQYLKIATDEDVDVKTRAKMLEHIMARVFGPIPKEVNIKQDAPWETVFTRFVSEDGAEAPQWEEDQLNRLKGRLETKGEADQYGS